MTLVDERPKVDSTDTGEDDYRHYFRKGDLDLNLLHGVAIRAACGFVKTSLASPAADKPTCPKCKWHYENTMWGDSE